MPNSNSLLIVFLNFRFSVYFKYNKPGALFQLRLERELSDKIQFYSPGCSSTARLRQASNTTKASKANCMGDLVHVEI